MDRRLLPGAVLVLLMALSIALQAILFRWYIEDAAISFSYARNWAMGEGLVSWAGGERCEGYSNPTWVLLMALWQLVHVDGFVSSKVMGFAFGAATVPLVAAIARHVRPDREAMPLYAAAFLVGNTQFTIWNASGLENSILNFGIALAVYRALVEQERGRWPLSPLAWLLVAVSRPEGIAYAALGGFWQLVWALADGRGVGPSAVWLAVFWAPWALYNAVRYEYFAYWWPNTYYAKEDAGDFQPWVFGTKGWKYIRGWAFDLGHAYLLPIYLIGLLSLSRWRGAVAALLSLWLAFVLLPGSQVPSVKPFADLVDKRVWQAVGQGFAVPIGLVCVVAVVGVAAGFIDWRKGRATALDPVLQGLRAAAFAALPIAMFYAVAPVARHAAPPDAWLWPAANAGLLGGGLFIGGLAAGAGVVQRRASPLVSGLAGLALLMIAARVGLEVVARVAVAEIPTWKLTWNGVRIASVFGVALIAPLFAVGRPGWRPLVLAWQIAVFALFFALWSGGDWMKQFRWMASLTVPAAVLLAAGLAELQDRAQWRWGTARESRWTAPAHLLGLGLVVAYGTVNGHNLARFATKPETGPFSVKNRVEYMQGVGKRLHIDEPIVAIDVDQGAHLWWSGFQMMDLAGLIDVPMAHHEHEKAFMKEYVFDEMRPHFAHVHGGWASTSRIPQLPEWKEQYFEIPGYTGSPKGKTFHIGNHVRLDLIMASAWTGSTDQRVAFEEDVVLEGFVVPSDVAGQGRYLYAEVGVSSSRDREPGDTFRVTLFLVDDAGNVMSWDVPVGYDWYEVGDWKPGQVFHGRFSLPVPEKAVPGRYEVGFYVTGSDGHLLRPIVEPLPPGALAGGLGDVPAKVAIGEVRFPVRVEVVPRDVIATRSADDLVQARALAARGACEDAEAAFLLGKHRNAWDESWYAAALPATAPDLARCWAKRTVGAERVVQVAAIKRARRWDHRDPVVIAAAAPLAEAWYAAGLAARERQEWEAAYLNFSNALAAEPQRSWARRYAEEARNHRLGLDKPRPPEGKGKGKPAKGGGKTPRRPGSMLPGGIMMPENPDGPGPDEVAPEAAPAPTRPEGPEGEE